MRTFTTSLMIALLAAISAAEAQDTEPPLDDSFVVDGYGGGYRAGYHSSTLQEGVPRGYANVIRSAGDYNRLTGEGAIYAAEARRMNIENYGQFIDAYYAAKQKAREYRAAERGPRATSEDLIRYSQRALPDRLDASELHALTGTLTWPVLLRDDAFKPHRQTIDAFFYKRACDDELTTADYLTARQVAGTLKSELKARIRQFPLQEYAVAKRFLRSLDYEAQLPAGTPTEVADAPSVPKMVAASHRTVRR